MKGKSEAYITWTRLAQSNGVALVAFHCPKCGEQILTQRPPEKHIWDSFACCPWCDAVFFKQVKGAAIKVRSVITK